VEKYRNCGILESQNLLKGKSSCIYTQRLSRAGQGLDLEKALDEGDAAREVDFLLRSPQKETAVRTRAGLKMQESSREKQDPLAREGRTSLPSEDRTSNPASSAATRYGKKENAETRRSSSGKNIMT